MSEVLTCRKCGESFHRTSRTGRIPTMCQSCRRDKPAAKKPLYVERESEKGKPHPPLSKPFDEPIKHPFFPSAKPTVDLGSCDRCWYMSEEGCRMCKRGDMGTCEFYADHEIWKPRR